MIAICLSSALILRCEDLSQKQEIILLVAPALGLIFATTLLIAKWGSTSRKHFLLVAEGWAYFVLALLDFLSHVLPFFHNTLNTFKITDIIIGASSFLPLSFYILFLFLQTRSGPIATLPKRFQWIVKALLITFIPAIITLNEISSLIGISYRFIPNLSSTGVTLATGFANSKQQTVWVFFTSITLAIFIGYQAVAFMLNFYRLVNAFVSQRKIEDDNLDKRHLFKGVGWTALGLKLGAIESAVAFADAAFGVNLLRRIFRMISRAAIIIGELKGMDVVEDFDVFTREIQRENKPKRGSTLRNLIGNPLGDTFEKMSPTATRFYNRPRAANNQPSSLAYAEAGPSNWSASQRSKERVTIHYAPGEAPKLDMRLSALGMPDASDLIRALKSKHQSLDIPRPNPSSRPDDIMVYSAPIRPAFFIPSAATMPPLRRASTSEYSYVPPGIDYYTDNVEPERRGSEASAYTSTSDSHKYKDGRQSKASRNTSDSFLAMKDLAEQFPSLPPRTLSGTRLGADGAPLSSPVESVGRRSRSLKANSERSSSSLVPSVRRTRSSSATRKARETYAAYNSNPQYQYLVAHPPSQSEETTPSSFQATTEFSRTPSINTPNSDSDEFDVEGQYAERRFEDDDEDRKSGVGTAEWIATKEVEAPRSLSNQASLIEAYRRGYNPGTSFSTDSSRYDPPPPLPNWHNHDSTGSNGSHPFMDMSETGDIEEGAIQKALLYRPNLARIKSVGTVQGPRGTPSPTHHLDGFARKSVSLEQLMMPIRHAGTVGSRPLHQAAVRADSGVLGEDDQQYVERSRR